MHKKCITQAVEIYLGESFVTEVMGYMDLAAHLSKKKNFFQHLFHVFHCVYLVLLPGFQVQIHRLFN